MGSPFYGYVVQVHEDVLCACVHLYVDMLISSHGPIGLGNLGSISSLAYAYCSTKSMMLRSNFSPSIW
jgi:hypothetical protein